MSVNVNACVDCGAYPGASHKTACPYSGPVQGAASASSDNKYDCPGDVRFAAASATVEACPDCGSKRPLHDLDCPVAVSASGAKGAALEDVGRDLDGIGQPYAGAIVLLETIAHCGMSAISVDGSPTPNRDLCLRFAKELRTATLADRPPAVQPKLVLALPDYERRRIVIASDEVVDGERLVCVAIEQAATPAPEQEAAPADLRKAAQSVVASFQDQHVSLAALQRQVNMLADALAAPAPATTPAEQPEGNDRADDFGQKVTALIGEIRKAKSLAWRDSKVEELIELIEPSSDVVPPFAATAGQHDSEEAAWEAHKDELRALYPGIAGDFTVVEVVINTETGCVVADGEYTVALARIVNGFLGSGDFEKVEEAIAEEIADAPLFVRELPEEGSTSFIFYETGEREDVFWNKFYRRATATNTNQPEGEKGGA